MHFFLILILLWLPNVGKTAGSILDEQSNYQLEVALIYKIAKFIYWPDETNKQMSPEYFNICVLQNLDIYSALNVLRSRTIKSLPIKISHYDFSSEVSSQCRILFIPSSRKPYLQLIFKQLKNNSILTLSTLPDFAKQGGHDWIID